MEETQGPEEGLRDMNEKLGDNEWKKLRDMSGGTLEIRVEETQRYEWGNSEI